MSIVKSPWRLEFLKLVSSARKELRIAAPFYSTKVIEDILSRSSRRVQKVFLVALSEQGVKGGSQSVEALRSIDGEPSCQLRLIKKLHAKFYVSDRRAAIVTSANLTDSGLDSNVELGVRSDDPDIVGGLVKYFDQLWVDGEPLKRSDLSECEKWAKNTGKGGGRGKSFGGRVRFGRADEEPPSPTQPALGWILVHNNDWTDGDGTDLTSPRATLKAYFKPGKLWNWWLVRPIRESGVRYRVLMAWRKEVFGEATVSITHQVSPKMRDDYNFAFVLLDYKPLRKPIPFGRMCLGSREHNHRSLIRLDAAVIKAFERNKRAR